jgi:hypothetical protein
VLITANKFSLSYQCQITEYGLDELKVKS